MADWTNEYKHPIDYLLLESGDYVLQEDEASLLVLEQTGKDASLWTNVTKN